MREILILIFFFVFNGIVFGSERSHETDSVIRVLDRFETMSQVEWMQVLELTNADIDQEQRARLYVAIGNYQVLIKRDFPEAASNFMKAMEIHEISEFAKSDALNGMGVIYSNLQRMDIALDYHKESIAIMLEHYPDSLDAISSLYGNLAFVYADASLSDSSKLYFQKALKYSSKAENRFGVYLNIGFYSEDHDSAYYYTNLAMQYADSLDFSLYKVFSRLNMGAVAIRQQNYHSALAYLKTADSLSRESHQFKYFDEIRLQEGIANIQLTNYHFGIKLIKDQLFSFNERDDIYNIQKSYYWLKAGYHNLGNYEKALDVYEKYVDAGKELEQRRELNHEVADQISTRFNIWKQEYEHQKNLVKVMRTVLFGFIILLVSAFMGWIIHRYHNRQKLVLIKSLNEKLNLDLSDLQCESQQTHQQLLFKSLKIQEKKGFLEEVSLKIKELSDGFATIKDREKLLQLNLYIRKNLQCEWGEGIEYHFDKVHPKFIKHLLQVNPKLTKNEIRLASLIKLNFSTKEISDITKQHNNAINVAKSRLKKNLSLTKEDDLYEYLQNLDGLKSKS